MPFFPAGRKLIIEAKIVQSQHGCTREDFKENKDSRKGSRSNKNLNQLNYHKK